MSIKSKSMFAAFMESEEVLFSSPVSSIVTSAKDVMYNEIIQDEMYNELLQEHDFYYDAVLSLLDEDAKDYMHELEEINEQIRHILIFSAYNKGMADACLLYSTAKMKEVV